MAATIPTMAMPTAKCLTPKASTSIPPKPISLLSLKTHPKLKLHTSPATVSAIAAAVFSSLSSTDAALAAQQIADLAEGNDNRGLALLIPIIPAILWVLYNILQPALNQLNKMRSEKAIIAGLGVGGAMAAAGLLAPESASAAVQQVAEIAEATADNRGLALLIPLVPAILWVLYNILQPALNQLNRMRSG